MSERWPGGIVRSTPVTPTGPLQNGTAPGIWTMEQAAYWTKQGLWPTAGNFTAVEDVFSTYLYTGNGTSQTITNGINLSGQGGLVWTKRRVNTGGIGNTYHILTDTVRGANKQLYSNGSDAQATNANMITSFNANGYSIGSDGNVNFSNVSPQTYVSWSFREAPNFFDVVTYTGNGTNTQVQSHSLGTTPGMIIVKQTSASGENWVVWHRSLATSNLLYLNTTDAAFVDNGTRIKAANATTFTVGLNGSTGANGATYVAYLFAHDTSSTGIIQCGSFTTGASPVSVNLGWEPQWVLFKTTSTTDDWQISDNMRGLFASGANEVLRPNTDGPEGTNGNFININSTGFLANNGVYSNGTAFVYIAIRRGPMRTPTLGTTVFSPLLSSATGTTLTSNFSADMVLGGGRQSGYETGIVDRLRGFANTTTGDTKWLITQNSNAELSVGSAAYYNAWNTTTLTGPYLGSGSFVNYVFRRAPSFMDVVCYTGTGSATTFNHNLGVAPELMIVKQRNSANDWAVYGAVLPNANTNRLILNGTQAATANSNLLWNSTSPTSTVFSVGTSTAVNGSGSTYVAYLFASCPGVSKVGSYTGTGALQTINCGFTTGARFVLIKRTDSTGDWFVWNSATGISSGNDPYILLNTTGGEVTGTNYVDTTSVGFQVTAAAPAGINANGGSYIFLAVA